MSNFYLLQSCYYRFTERGAYVSSISDFYFLSSCYYMFTERGGAGNVNDRGTYVYSISNVAENGYTFGAEILSSRDLKILRMIVLTYL